jgi:hypothetical protein
MIYIIPSIPLQVSLHVSPSHSMLDSLSGSKPVTAHTLATAPRTPTIASISSLKRVESTSDHRSQGSGGGDPTLFDIVADEGI